MTMMDAEFVVEFNDGRRLFRGKTPTCINSYKKGEYYTATAILCGGGEFSVVAYLAPYQYSLGGSVMDEIYLLFEKGAEIQKNRIDIENINTLHPLDEDSVSDISKNLLLKI